MQEKRILSEEHKRKIGVGNKKAHPMQYYDYVCKNCGKKFVDRQRNKKYCSQECYHKEKKFIITCLLCGEEFNAKVPNAKYCLKCRTKECKTCGKIFILNSTEVNGSTRNTPKKYCSPECFHKSTKGRVSHNKENGVNIVCAICGKVFNVWKSRIERNVKYCSYKCTYDAKSLVTNVNHPLWKGGHDLYSRMLSESEGSFYRNRRIVLERDGNTCQYCGFQGVSNYMDVHHILSVIKGGSSLPENMITLCRKCHNSADKGKIPMGVLQGKVLKEEVVC